MPSSQPANRTRKERHRTPLFNGLDGEPGELVGSDVLGRAGGLTSDNLEVVVGLDATTPVPMLCTPASRSPSKAACSDDNDWQPDGRRYPIRKVTTPVPVEGGVVGGALPMSAGSSFHGRRKPNGSACQRRQFPRIPLMSRDQLSRLITARSSNARMICGAFV
jgi:hypothetical protein